MATDGSKKTPPVEAGLTAFPHPEGEGDGPGGGGDTVLLNQFKGWIPASAGMAEEEAGIAGGGGRNHRILPSPSGRGAGGEGGVRLHRY